jgi:hypothetical protein
MKPNHIYPMFLALLAAMLFGASAPLAKILLSERMAVLLPGESHIYIREA